MSHKKLRPFIVKVSVLGYFPLLRHNQNGFIPGRSKISHILTFRRLIEGEKS